MPGWWRRWLDKAWPGADAALALPQEAWQTTLNHYPFLQRPDAAGAVRLQKLAAEFLRQKEFHGAGGLHVTDAMALAVAAQACLPLVDLMRNDDARRALRWYDDFVGIVLHPGEVLARRESQDEAGVVHQWDEALTGEAMDGGPVMLSWADVADAGASAAQGYNVVIHEFAHKLDLRDGKADGCPPLPPGFLGASTAAASRQRWMAVLNAEYQTFCDQVQAAGRFSGLVTNPWLDAYGAESPSEFFAVTAEAFFVNPAALQQQSPAMHDLLTRFFRPHDCR